MQLSAVFITNPIRSECLLAPTRGAELELAVVTSVSNHVIALLTRSATTATTTCSSPRSIVCELVFVTDFTDGSLQSHLSCLLLQTLDLQLQTFQLFLLLSAHKHTVIITTTHTSQILHHLQQKSQTRRRSGISQHILSCQSRSKIKFAHLRTER